MLSVLGPVSPEAGAAIELELRGVRAAQNGALDEAVGLFTEAIRQMDSTASARAASAYNNRAQAKQLQGDSEGRSHVYTVFCSLPLRMQRYLRRYIDTFGRG